MWLHSLKVAQLLRSAACLHTNQSRSYLNHLVLSKCNVMYSINKKVYKSNTRTVCPTRYRTRHFFNNSNTNQNIATKFEQEYVRCVRNEKECVCSAPNCCDAEQRSPSQPGSVASGTLCIFFVSHIVLETVKVMQKEVP